MKKQPLTLVSIKEHILELKGKEVKMCVNRGRKKIIYYDAIIEDTYNSVFTVKNLQKVLNANIHTYSYSDILCGDVKVTLP
ncbi:MAG: Veg family protein [Clostridia bacterium]|nr:Veg family protein [Clostridia bacterium]